MGGNVERISEKTDIGGKKVGFHLRVNACDGALSIHINRNLKSINADNVFSYSRILEEEVRQDFTTLARLIKEGVYKDISILRGSGTFPDNLGRRFGFDVRDYSLPAWFASFYESLTTKKKLRGNTHNKRTLKEFTIEKEKFIRLYL
jgi:hypothetical protein